MAALLGDNPILRVLAALATALVALQITLGALVIVLLVPVWAAVAHQAIGVLLFATVAAALATVLRAPSIAKPEIGHVVQHPLHNA